MATVYQINKGVNRSIEFRGIKAQYLAILAAGMVALLLVSAVAFAAGTPAMIAIPVIVLAGYCLVTAVQRYSKRYGEHGLAKKAAQVRMPAYLTASSRKLFLQLKNVCHETE
ncbi:DUF4133 domain-containing protein [Chitinophaga alhagiae]|uniref:DUF4133 domain-containing protein n=1 Tax=Chitinophaga alhagiae TaxID=2203219 RepID=UPI000E5C2149|nr:DUF4133 domain-containing protein [Chitinophaga alhagiae]